MPTKSTKRLLPKKRKSKLKRSFSVVNRNGLHARAAAVFVKEAQKFESQVVLRHGGMEVSGRSILGVMMLGAPYGATIELEVEGKDATEAMKDLGKLVKGGFHHV